MWFGGVWGSCMDGGGVCGWRGACVAGGRGHACTVGKQTVGIVLKFCLVNYSASCKHYILVSLR